MKVAGGMICSSFASVASWSHGIFTEHGCDTASATGDKFDKVTLWRPPRCAAELQFRYFNWRELLQNNAEHLKN
jgi:hypothetical protein